MAGTIVANTLNTDTGLFSTNNAYTGIAKAWVNFNGGNPATIVSSFNVSSVTYTALGYYTIAFTTAQTAANYCISGAVNNAGSGIVINPSIYTTSSVGIITATGSGSAQTNGNNFVIVHGN